MPESQYHINYVKKIVSYVESTFSADEVAFLLSDSTDCPERCPKVIGGFVPDVYVKTARCAIIGEAKTDNDIENDHTAAQINSYIEELRSHTECSKHIILCSSMLLFATLKNMIIRKKRKEPLDDITFHILDNYKNIATI